MPRLRLPFILNAFFIASGALLVGFKAVSWTPTPLAPETVVQNGTRTIVSTRTVKRVVHGKVVRRDEKVYIRVPLIVVHTDHHTIKIPAHNLPLRSAAATIVNPLVTVYVPVASTVYVPTTVTQTVELPPSTVTTTIPTTVTLPLDPTTSDQGGTTNAPSVCRPFQRERVRRLSRCPGHASLPQSLRGN